jgi:hypothetical protein
MGSQAVQAVRGHRPLTYWDLSGGTGLFLLSVPTLQVRKPSLRKANQLL